MLGSDERIGRRRARRAVVSTLLSFGGALAVAPLMTSIESLSLGVVAAMVCIGLAAFGVLSLRRVDGPSLHRLQRTGLMMACATVLITAVEAVYAATHYRQWQREETSEHARSWAH